MFIVRMVMGIVWTLEVVHKTCAAITLKITLKTLLLVGCVARIASTVIKLFVEIQS